jgi:hypothetical protein
MVSFKPQPLYYRGNKPQFPLDRRLGGLQSQSALARTQNPCSAHIESLYSAILVTYHIPVTWLPFMNASRISFSRGVAAENLL